MSIKVALEHRTSYTFDRLVRVYPHIVRLRPAPHSRTSIEAYSLRIEPADHFINWQQDALGNFLARLVFPNPMRQLRITVGLIADLKVINPFDFFIEDWAEIWPCAGMAYPKALADDLRPYLRPVDEDGDGSGPGELTQAWVRNFTVPDGTRTIDFLVALNRAINADVGYCVRMEPGVQTPDFTLRTGVGSCRDSAWLLVSILRQFGLAARFVSGYLVQLASDIEALDGPSGPAADFTDLHAWAEAYIPGAGWIGLDPTSGLLAGEGHIPLAATPVTTSAATPTPTPPPAAPRCWRASMRPSPLRLRTCCRCTAATTGKAGPARTGGCAAVASCCSKGIRRRACGCRWIRSAGAHPGHRLTPTR